MILVKHAQADYRLHKDDGTVVATWSWDRDWLLDRTDAMRAAVNSEASEWSYRDLTIEGENVPW